MQASDHTILNISCHCPLAPAGLTSFSTTSGFSPTYSMTPWNMSKSEKTIKKRKIRSLRPMFFFFLHSRSQSLNNLASAIYPCHRGQYCPRYIRKTVAVCHFERRTQSEVEKSVFNVCQISPLRSTGPTVEMTK